MTIIQQISPETIASVMEEIGLGLSIVDSTGVVQWANARAVELLQWSRERENSVLGCHPEPLREAVLLRMQRGKKDWHRVLEIGGMVVENLYFPVDLKNERGVLIVSRDVSEREQASRAQRQAAITDGLTGLFNRQYLNGFLSLASDVSGMAGVIMLDINGLKQVNDQQGHQAGDRLIVNTVELIRSSVRADDLVFRVGGDEFVILIRGNEAVALERVAERLTAVSELSTYGDPDKPCFSFGVAWASEAPNLDRLMALADQRMYELKREFYNSR